MRKKRNIISNFICEVQQNMQVATCESDSEVVCFSTAVLLTESYFSSSPAPNLSASYRQTKR